MDDCDSKIVSIKYHLISILLMLIGGITFGLHVYFSKFAALAFISTSSWLLIILNNKSSWGIIYFFIMVYIMNLIGVSWLKEFNFQSWLIAPIIYSLYYIPLYWIIRTVHNKWPKLPLLLLWPIAFTGIEWFRVHLSPGQLPFCLLSDSLVEYSKLIQIVDIFGTGFLTFIVCMFSGFLTDLILNYRRENKVKGNSFLIQFFIIAAVYGSTLIYGLYRDSEVTFSNGPRIGIIHPLFDKWISDKPDTNRLYILENLTKQLLTQKVDIIVWPENSLTFAYNEKTIKEFSSPTINRIRKLSIELNTPVLIDGPTWDEIGGEMLHTTTLVGPQKPIQEYDKVFLIPWSEYIPLHSVLSSISLKAGKNYLNFIKKFYAIPVSFKSGLLTNIQEMNITANNRIWYFGTAICFEIGVPDLIRKWNSVGRVEGRQGVDFILNPSNEVLLGSGIHRQTLNAARFRAIENRISIIKASNNGISAMIDPNGRIKQSLKRDLGEIGELGQPSSLLADVIVDSRKSTVYTKIGDVFSILCFIIAITATIIITILSKNVNKLKKWVINDKARLFDI